MKKTHIFLTVLLFTLLAASPGSAAEFNVDSLLRVSVGGVEGVDVLSDMTSMTVRGDVVLNGQPGKYVQHYKAPSNIYLRIELGALTLEQAYDGVTAWQRDFNNRVTVLDGFEEREVIKTAYFESASYLFDDRLKGSYSYLGDTTIMGSPYHSVEFYPLYVDTVVVYYDFETGLPAMQVGQVDQFVMITRLYDFVDTLGLVWPRKTETVAENAPIRISTTIRQIALNEPLTDVPFSPPRQAVTDAHFPADASSVTIPMRYRNGHIEVEGTINGDRNVLFVLDSGASMNLYHTDALDGLHIESVGEMPAQGISGFDQISLVRTDSVQIGELVLLGQIGGMIDLGWLPIAQEEEHLFGGLLGYDFLSRFPVLIDYEKQELTVYNPSGFSPPDGGTEVPFSLTMQVPTVRAEVSDVRGRFIVDLGNAMALNLHRPYFERHGFDSLLLDVGKGMIETGGVGGGSRAITAVAPRVEIGALEMDSVWTVIPQEEGGLAGSVELAGNIGNRLLERYTVLFDYGGERLIFYPRPAATEPAEMRGK